jgi:hypothetical protein
MAKIVNINIKPIVYEKDTDGEYVIDINGDKQVLIAYPNVKLNDSYEYKIVITEFI